MSEQEFLADVAKHEMQTLHSNGLYRHLRFSRPGDSAYWFDLVTIPGKLIYTGDMGTFVFSRLADMFVFFRTDREYAHKNGKQLGINLGYWSEKLIAIDGSRHQASAMEFDEDAFRRVINEYRVNWLRDAHASGELDKEARRELWEAVQDEVLDYLDSSGEVAQHKAYEFSHQGHRFTDLFEHSFTRPTHTLFWCCYAIAWGIQQYDNAQMLEAA